MMATVVAAIILTVELVATAFVAWRLTRWFAPAAADDPLERSTVGLLVGLLTIVGVSQITAALGIFSRLWVVAVHVGLAAAVTWLVPSEMGTPTITRTRWRVTGDGAFTLGVIGAGMALLGLASYVSLRRPTTEFDTLQYHFPDAVHWLQTHSLWALPVLSAPYADNAYPSNAELLASWLMQPTHTSAVALFEPLAFGLLAVLGTALLARNLGGRAWLGALGGLVVVASPIFYLNVDTLMTDLAGAGGVLAGVALLLSAPGQVRPARRLLLAGLAIGLSVGSKDTALAFAALSTVWVLVAPSTTSRPRWRQAGMLLVGIALPSFVWFLRDWIALGNPLFPEGVVLFGHPILHGTASPYTVYRTTMLDHFVRLHTGAIRTWWRGVLDQLGPTALLSTLGIVVGLATARGRGDRRRAGTALIALAGSALYLATPYTGGGRAGNATLITAQLRYDLVPLLLGIVLLAVVLPRWLSVVSLVAALAVDYDRRVLVATGLHHSRLLTLGVLVALQLLVVVVLAASAYRFGSWTVLTGRFRLLVGGGGSAGRRAPTAVLAAAVAVVPVAVTLRAGATYPSRIPHALRDVTASGPILELGVPNVAQLFGPHLGRRITTVGMGSDGNREPDRATFLHYLATHHPVAIVISPLPESLDPGYLAAVRPPPRSWVLVGHTPEIGTTPDAVYLPR